MTALKLRPYQQDAVDAVQADWAGGDRAVLGMAATGAGKTHIFLAVIDEAIRGTSKRALIIAHRSELITQPLERLVEFWPQWSGQIGIVKAERDECDRQIIVATIQTLSSNGRLDRILSHGKIDVVITDECHHSTAATYRQVYDRLAEANSDLVHLGVTATPIRADGEALREVYSKESFHEGIREMVSKGYLVPPRWLAIQTGISLKEIDGNGDYVVRSSKGRGLADVYETSNCFELVAESHRKYATGRQALAFTSTVEGAYRLAEKFLAVGISAEAADATTHKRDRAQILQDFRAGKLEVLVNVGLYTEGLDVPRASCIHMVRPTKSDGLYVQCVGRGLRTNPGKDDCLILDYAPAEYRNIVMLGDVLGIPIRKDAYMDPDATEPGDVLGGFTYTGEAQFAQGSAAEIVSRQLDYMEDSPYSWYRRDGLLSLGLGEDVTGVDRTMIVTTPNSEGLVTLWGVARRKRDRYKIARPIVEGISFEDAMEAAQEVIARHGQPALVQKQLRWRRQAPSLKQARFARSLGVYDETTNKGQMAQAITHALAVQVIGPRGREGGPR